MATKPKTATKAPEFPTITLAGYGTMKGKTLDGQIVSQDGENITIRIANPKTPGEFKDFTYSSETGKAEGADPKRGFCIGEEDLVQFQPDEPEDEDDEEEGLPEVGETVSFDLDGVPTEGIISKVDEEKETVDIKVGKKTHRGVSWDDLLADEEDEDADDDDEEDEEAEEEDADEDEEDEEDDDEELIPEVGDEVSFEKAGKTYEGAVTAVDEEAETVSVKVGTKTHKGVAWDDLEFAEDEDVDEAEDEDEEDEVPAKKPAAKPATKTPAAKATAKDEPAAKRPLTGAAKAAAERKASADPEPVAKANELEVRIPDGLYEYLLQNEVTKVRKAATPEQEAFIAAMKAARHKKWWHTILNKSAATHLVRIFEAKSATWREGGVQGSGFLRAAVRIGGEITEKFRIRVRLSSDGKSKVEAPAEAPVAKPAAKTPAATTKAPASKTGLTSRVAGKRRRA